MLLTNAKRTISITPITRSEETNASKLCISTLYLNRSGMPRMAVRNVISITVVRGAIYHNPPVEFRDLWPSLQYIWSDIQNMIIEIKLCKMSEVPATEELSDFVITNSNVAKPISWIVPMATNLFRSASANSIKVLKNIEIISTHRSTTSCDSLSNGSTLNNTAVAVFTRKPLKKIEKEVDAST